MSQYQEYMSEHALGPNYRVSLSEKKGLKRADYFNLYQVPFQVLFKSFSSPFQVLFKSFSSPFQVLFKSMFLIDMDKIFREFITLPTTHN
jgi:hypothetical protein